MSVVIREKKIYCGSNYLEVDIFPTVELKRSRKGKRAKKKKESIDTQKNLNDKNARRKFIQLVETNFTGEDIVLHLTYSDRNFPSLEQMEKNIRNFIRRLKRKRASKKMSELKYILVTSYTTEEEEEEGVQSVRPHHHLLINGGLDRDTIEELWSKRRKKGEKKGEMLGYANAQRIQYDDIEGITRLGQYLSRNLTHQRRWTCSQNLKRPESRTNDYRYSKRKIEKLATRLLDIRFWEKQYPGWTIKDRENGFESIYNEWTGWSIYLKLRKKE